MADGRPASWSERAEDRVPSAWVDAVRPPRKTPGRPERDLVPDVRDGLTRIERVVLWKLRELELERPGRHIPTAQLYGRVSEHLDLTPDELQTILAKLGKGTVVRN